MWHFLSEVVALKYMVHLKKHFGWRDDGFKLHIIVLSNVCTISSRSWYLKSSRFQRSFRSFISWAWHINFSMSFLCKTRRKVQPHMIWHSCFLRIQETGLALRPKVTPWIYVWRYVGIMWLIAHLFEWPMARFKVKKTRFYHAIGLCSQYIDTIILGSIVTAHLGGVMSSLKRNIRTTTLTYKFCLSTLFLRLELTICVICR